MRKILYLGDTELQGAAGYLAGLMHDWGWDFDYLRSDEKPVGDQWDADYALFILSDYPAGQLDDGEQQRLLARVRGGAGLLMIGGWESYHGLGGDWDGTSIGNILPVEISSDDDRRNCDQPVLVRRLGNHPITDNLPWEARPPAIGGFNEVTAKPDSQVILEACLFAAKSDADGDFQFQQTERHPLLALGQHERGRTAALMTDVAPHWVGPLVDWGTPRVSAQALGGNEIEVGCHYAVFFKQLLAWTAAEL